jgi:hypothetical protein
MGRTFDVLEHLQRQLSAQRSGGKVQLPVKQIELDAAREKKIHRLGSKYREYPSLDRTQLRNGYQLCLGNATGLMNDAAMMREAGSLRTAYLILLLAVEELRNATQLYEAGCSEVQDWEEWWGRYFKHPKEQSTPRETGGEKEADERLSRGSEELLYVDFDRKDEKFIPPREGQDSELLKLVEKETAYAEGILKALAPHAFERWEFEELAQQSPEIAPSVLYARIEELVSQEPTVSERDLLTAIARDLGKSPDDFAAGFERWKEVAPKARVYLDLLRGLQDRIKKQGEA